MELWVSIVLFFSIPSYAEAAEATEVEQEAPCPHQVTGDHFQEEPTQVYPLVNLTHNHIFLHYA